MTLENVAKVKDYQKKKKADPTTTVLSLMKKLQLWGYLKIYLQLKVSISTRHCHTEPE